LNWGTVILLYILLKLYEIRFFILEKHYNEKIHYKSKNNLNGNSMTLLRDKKMILKVRFFGDIINQIEKTK